jgi:hypothetical protein
MLEMLAVKSQAVKKIGWEEPNLMHVEFTSGDKGFYENVPESLYDKIRTSTSIGTSLHALVKSKPKEYPYRKTKLK